MSHVSHAHTLTPIHVRKRWGEREHKGAVHLKLYNTYAVNTPPMQSISLPVKPVFIIHRLVIGNCYHPLTGATVSHIALSSLHVWTTAALHIPTYDCPGRAAGIQEISYSPLINVCRKVPGLERQNVIHCLLCFICDLNKQFYMWEKSKTGGS